MPAGHSHIIREIRGLFEWMKNVVTDSLSIGEEPNYTYLDENGIYLKGTASVWEDIQSSLIGARLTSTAGAIDYDFDENALEMSNGSLSNINDRVIFNYQLPHSARQDGQLNLHIHWEQTDLSIHTFSLEYRVQSNGAEKETTWTRVDVDTGGANDVFTPPVGFGTFSQITKLVDLDTTDWGISAQVQFRLTKTAGTGSVRATYVDAHFEKDTMGSREEYVK